MSEWKISEIMCVINYPAFFEFETFIEAFHENLKLSYKSEGNVDYEKPQKMGLVQVINHAFKFKHGNCDYVVNVAPDIINIAMQNSEYMVNDKYDEYVASFKETAKEVWDCYNRATNMMIIVRVGIVSTFVANSVIRHKECAGVEWEDSYCSRRLFKFDKLNINGKEIRVVDNIFYDFENSPTTFEPTISKNIIDITLLPNSRGVATADKVGEVLDLMCERLCACKRNMFDAK